MRLRVDPEVEVRLRPGVDLTSLEGFGVFCADNPELRIERRRGDVVVAMPTRGLTGARNALLAMSLGVWALANAEGIAFDSSAGFALDDRSVLSPDAAWIRRTRLASLSDRERAGFLPLAPDFVVEFRSETDRRAALQEKMEAWRANGARLGVLLDPEERRVHLYRPDAEPVVLDDPAAVDCSPELPGFVLDVRALFDLTL